MPPSMSPRRAIFSGVGFRIAGGRVIANPTASLSSALPRFGRSRPALAPRAGADVRRRSGGSSAAGAWYRGAFVNLGDRDSLRASGAALMATSSPSFDFFRREPWMAVAVARERRLRSRGQTSTANTSSPDFVRAGSASSIAWSNGKGRVDLPVGLPVPALVPMPIPLWMPLFSSPAAASCFSTSTNSMKEDLTFHEPVVTPPGGANSVGPPPVLEPTTADDRSGTFQPSRTRRGCEKRDGTDTPDSVPPQTHASALALFDALAPHLEIRTVKQISKQLKRLTRGGTYVGGGDGTKSQGPLHSSASSFVSGGDDAELKLITLVGRLEDAFGSLSVGKGRYSWSSRTHPWIKPIICRFLGGVDMASSGDGGDDDRATTNGGEDFGRRVIDAYERRNNSPLIPLPEHMHVPNPAQHRAHSWSDPTFPPNRNRRNIGGGRGVGGGGSVDVLLRTREACVERPLYWTMGQYHRALRSGGGDEDHENRDGRSGGSEKDKKRREGKNVEGECSSSSWNTVGWDDESADDDFEPSSATVSEDEGVRDHGDDGDYARKGRSRQGRGRRRASAPVEGGQISRAERLQSIHGKKTTGKIADDAERIASFLADRLPQPHFDRLMVALDDIVAVSAAAKEDGGGNVEADGVIPGPVDSKNGKFVVDGSAALSGFTADGEEYNPLVEEYLDVDLGMFSVDEYLRLVRAVARVDSNLGDDGDGKSNQRPKKNWNSIARRARLMHYPLENLRSRSRAPKTMQFIEAVKQDHTLLDRLAASPTAKEAEEADSQRKKKRGRQTQVLVQSLRGVSGTHCHAVAVELARYLYVDVVGSDDVAAVRKHHVLNKSEKNWNKVREEFARSALEAQRSFASWGERKPETGGDEEEIYEEDASIALSSSSSKAPQREKEALQRRIEDTIEGINRLSPLANKQKTGKVRGRPRKRVHLKFDAIALERPSSSHSGADNADSPGASSSDADSERIVFIDNLPIDTTDEEIDEIYSRYGKIQSIELFNLRPDLDPGPLSSKQRKECRKKMTQVQARKPYAQNHRPRTPVYGIVTFETAEGYVTATRPDLTIFGCVIRRHPVMSIKPRDVTTLYVENIPPNLFSVDVEYKIARFLHPHIYVSLDVSHQDYAEPRSCEIRFEDSETALSAYRLLRRAGDGVKNFMGGGGDCQVHWFRTPDDAEKIWTRQWDFFQ